MSALFSLIGPLFSALSGKNAAIIGAILLFIALIGASFWAGWYTSGLRYTAILSEQARTAALDKAAALQRSIQESERLRAIDNSIAFAAAERQQKQNAQKTKIATEVTRHVSRPDYHDCPLDDCELCLANAAARGHDPSRCPCQPHAALPAAHAHNPSH